MPDQVINVIAERLSSQQNPALAGFCIFSYDNASLTYHSIQQMSDINKFSLPPNTVDLWLVEPQKVTDDALLTQYVDLMTQAEREKQQRLMFASDRHDALVTRGFVRTVLSKYADVLPQDWRFEKGIKGKPEIVNSPIPLKFNLSHTKDMIICVVASDVELGVDVEYIKRQNAFVKIAKLKFAPREYQEMLTRAQEEQFSRFFDYWTLKESYIKAVGLGLSIPLHEFHFTINGDNDIQIAFEPERNDDPQYWQSRLMWGSCDHRIAISIKDLKQRKMALRCFETVPLVYCREVSLPING